MNNKATTQNPKGYRDLIIFLAGLLLVGSTADILAAPCESDETNYKIGLELSQKGKDEAALNYLETSVDVCDSYASSFLLGRTYQNLNETRKSLRAYKKAQELSGNRNERALAIARYAEVLSVTGMEYEALSLIHAAREMHSQPTPWMNDLMFSLDKKLARAPVTQELVTRSLGTHQFGLLASSAKPTVNIRINFEFDSTEVDDFSRQNLQALAKTLASVNYASNSFKLVGHTDTRGDEKYNHNLSVRRAAAIKSMLEGLQPELKGRLVAAGSGESSPLYTGTSSEEHRLNRRLQVVVD